MAAAVDQHADQLILDHQSSMTDEPARYVGLGDITRMGGPDRATRLRRPAIRGPSPMNRSAGIGSVIGRGPDRINPRPRRTTQAE